MSKAIIIFGAGGFGERYLANTTDKVVAFLDNSKTKQGTTLNGVEIYPPEQITKLEYDVVVVVVSPGFEDDIVQQLVSLGVPEWKIETPLRNSNHIVARQQWLVDFVSILKLRDVKGNVAEAGVFRGDFAKHINTLFPDKTLYLFDTFEGFPAQDVALEEIKSNSKEGYYDATSMDTVLNKLPHPQKAVIKKGYFPETAVDVQDTFCFVNLDLDLYKPTYEGLKFFWDKMSSGGVILIHDYFGHDFPNVKTAIADFEAYLQTSLNMIPIGDGLSLAVIKPIS